MLDTIRCELPAEREPWKIPLSVRTQCAAEAIRQGKRLALILYHHPDTSTFRYRGYNMYQASLESDAWQSVYFFLNELKTVISFLPTASVLILSRLPWEHSLDALVTEARAKRVPVLYDIDDLVCDLRYLPLVTSTLNVHFGGNADYDFWFAYFSRQEYMASMADGFLTTNDFLGARLSERFGKPYRIAENSLNREQLAVSAQCRRQKQAGAAHNGFRIGYFSGTPSHINDFRTIQPEILRFLKEHPDATLEVVGFMEFSEEVTPFLRDKRVVFTPLVDFMELQRLIAQVDVNLVPLVNNTFTNCKSELKYFEAAAVLTPTLAAPTYTYRQAITHGETGFLCRQGQWYDTLSALYDDRSLGQRIAENACAHALENYSGAALLRQMEEAYGYFSGSK